MPDSTDDLNKTATAAVFHSGELMAQQRAGVESAYTQQVAQFIRHCMPEQHREFFSSLTYLIISARDEAALPWVTVLTGTPGFIQSPDPQHLTITAAIAEGDALAGQIRSGAEVGILGIELDTRRRNRVNGTVISNDGKTLTLKVDQSFGNCPQYITPRSHSEFSQHSALPVVASDTVLSAEMMQWIKQSDTLFVGTGIGSADNIDNRTGMDASHRGGAAGFVQVVDNTRLILPDYAGNKFFNTIGNLLVNPGIGLLFINFDTGGLLQITGRASIDWDAGESGDIEAQRLIHIDILHVIQLENALPYRWAQPGYSTREYLITKKASQTEDVCAFELAPRDNGPLPVFQPGQHLPVEIQLQDKVVRRTYSLSGPPMSDTYRISVKRQDDGIASTILHRLITTGHSILAGEPQGTFTLDNSNNPVVLISAGIGITPMISMLHALADTTRQCLFIHGSRYPEQIPHLDEIEYLTSSNSLIRSVFFVSRLTHRPGPDSHVLAGRVSISALAHRVPFATARCYLCGPPGLVADMSRDLIAAGADESKISVESF